MSIKGEEYSLQSAVVAAKRRSALRAVTDASSNPRQQFGWLFRYFMEARATFV